MHASRFRHVHLAGDWMPPFLNPDLSLREACERSAAQLKELGCTAMALNYITTPYHPLFYLYPDEVYMFFGNYGAGLEMFAASEYNRNLWPAWYLEENLQRLRLLGEAAERHGLTGLLLLCEPRMQRPEIFDRHPSWRGPRVDNPFISATPVFSLNTDIPEVQDHYRQMLRKVLDTAPCLQNIAIFAQDSGSGFSFAQNLYCGPHGGRLHADKPLAQRVFDFCTTLRDEGRTVQPGFEVAVCSSFTPEEFRELAAGAPDGVHAAVQGPESWCGGLEDQWAWNQCGPQRLDEIGFDAAREERVAGFKEKLDHVRQHGRRPHCMSEAPHDLFFQLRVVPAPWEPLEILDRYDAWDTEAVYLRGYLNFASENPHDINQAALARYLKDPGLSPEEAVRGALADWVVEPVVAPLEQALRDVEAAVRFRPHFKLFFERELTLFPGPLVPDPTSLTAGEKSFYWTVGHETLTRVHDPMYWAPRLDAVGAAYALRQFETATFASLAEARQGFDAAREAAAGDERSLACIDELAHYAEVYACLQRTICHAAMMAVHWRELREVDVPAPAEIVEKEIANTERWIECLGDNPDKWVRLAPHAGGMYSSDRGLPDHLRSRIQLMKDHAQDEVIRMGGSKS